MNLTRQDVKERKKYERTRDCRWLAIEESKLQRKLTELEVEHANKLRLLNLEKVRFRANVERKGINSHSCSSLHFPDESEGRRHSTSDIGKLRSPPTSDSNDSRRGSQERPTRKGQNQCVFTDIYQTPSSPNHTSSRPDTPIDSLAPGSIIMASGSAPQSPSRVQRSAESGDSPANGNSNHQPRERANTLGYKPKLPGVRE